MRNPILSLAAVLALGLIGATLVGAGQSKERYSYLVARIPASSVSMEIDESWHLHHKAMKTQVHPVEYFAKDGWELNQVVREPDGSFVCFFRKPR